MTRMRAILGGLGVWGATAWVAVAQVPPAPQPGLKWSEAEIKKVALHIRAGRTLTPKSWPGGARVAVCLSFDPDNFTIALNRGTATPVAVATGEFGALSGLPRILRLLDKYGVPASFYIPAVAALLHPQMIAEIRKRPQHEVAMHGWIHEDPLELDDPGEEWRLMTQALDLLERQWGRRPVGNRNPSWTMSVYTVDLLKKAGLLYDSSLQGMDAPHEILIDGQPTGLVELPVNWILDDAPFLPATAALPSARLVFQTFKDDFDRAYREGTLFMLTMHPHIIGQRSRIRYLEDLIVYMQSKPGVWFATAEEIARYVKQQMTN